jgi:hypothetical protein
MLLPTNCCEVIHLNLVNFPRIFCPTETYRDYFHFQVIVTKSKQQTHLEGWKILFDSRLINCIPNLYCF